jgi:hypothetical protein
VGVVVVARGSGVVGSAVLPAVVLVGLLAVLLAGGCAAPPSEPRPTPPASVPPSSAPSSTPPSAAERALPVYYVVETAAGPRLAREFHRVAGDDDGSDAVREMLAAPTGTDPDYRSPWPAGTALRSPVRAADGVITVDLTGVTPGAQLGSAGAVAAVQQLVYTVQGALRSTDPVAILLDGRAGEDLFGTVSTAEPVARADQYATRSLVQIDSPAHGAVLGSPVEVRGEAAVFEATLLWDVLRDGEVIRSGVTSTAEGQRFAPFSFTLDLPPGDYVVRIAEDDPSGGEGRPVLTDDKAITVR